MSEQTAISEPTQSICSNCGSSKTGEYCATCGQNSRNYLRAAYRVVGELLSETFEFDSRLFRSLRYLILSPGYLSNEFTAGRRARYISPVRLYLVVSLIFFFLLSITSRDIIIDSDGKPIDLETLSLESMTDLEDPEQLLDAQLDEAALEASHAASETAASVGEFSSDLDPEFEAELKEKFRSLAANPTEAWGRLLDNLPVTMFVLLPLFALLLKAAYRKRFYSEHFVFALHLHSFFYLVLTVLLFIPEPALGVDPESAVTEAWESLESALVLGCVAYGFVALKKAYQQSIIRTIVKGVLLMFGYSVLLTIGLSLTVVSTFLLY